ncbi:hypothetical protein C5C52_01420 [Rathayibacter sp. AY1E5]|uniref:HNH endonuclease signature motif containing protein n=1 Tax=Rathayibacter sp. AY1E5 TaxID=2080553 RepID=UPI000CE8236F|nr:hypothetical protein C5C52_01420 [Rathayibacter sp. AY1E5]
MWRKRLAPGIQDRVCTKCGHAIGQRLWDVDHIISIAIAPELAHDPSNIGPAHRRCNRSAGGKEGRAKQMGKAKVVRVEEQGLWEW